MRRDDSRPFIVDASDPFGRCYTWDPIWLKEVKHLSKVCEITTYHTWGYYGFFKPTPSEIIARIPENILGYVQGFEIIKQPKSMADLREQWTIVEAGYHRAIVALYTGLVPYTLSDRFERWVYKIFGSSEIT